MQVAQSELGLAFYGQVINTLWKQVAALSCTAIVWICSVVALEPRLGGAGAQTPVLPLVIMVIVFVLSGSETIFLEIVVMRLSRTCSP